MAAGSSPHRPETSACWRPSIAPWTTCARCSRPPSRRRQPHRRGAPTWAGLQARAPHGPRGQARQPRLREGDHTSPRRRAGSAPAAAFHRVSAPSGFCCRTQAPPRSSLQVTELVDPRVHRPWKKPRTAAPNVRARQGLFADPLVHRLWKTPRTASPKARARRGPSASRWRQQLFRTACHTLRFRSLKPTLLRLHCSPGRGRRCESCPLRRSERSLPAMQQCRWPKRSARRHRASSPRWNLSWPGRPTMSAGRSAFETCAPTPPRPHACCSRPSPRAAPRPLQARKSRLACLRQRLRGWQA